jgi:hypothetical protein
VSTDVETFDMKIHPSMVADEFLGLRDDKSIKI